MSNIGKNPSVKWLTLEPQAVDPGTPLEGSIWLNTSGTPQLKARVNSATVVLA